MAGAVGGGGLGDIAIRYGYYRYQTDVMLVTIVILGIAGTDFAEHWYDAFEKAGQETLRKRKEDGKDEDRESSTGTCRV